MASVWLGCSLGLLLMMWLPKLCAFVLDFTWAAHGAALVLLTACMALCYLLLTRAAKIDFMVIFSIIASGIIVFVPLYKKYLKK